MQQLKPLEPREPVTHKHRTLGVIVGAIVVAALAAAAGWWFTADPPLRYVTARVTRGEIQRTVQVLPGTAWRPT